MNLAEIGPIIANENKAIEFVESLMWPDGAVCPHCGGVENLYRIKANPKRRVRPGLWKCGQCRKQFTVKVGTIFEDSKLPLGKWLLAIYMMCSSKKGVSANQLHRSLGISYKAAWFVCHRIRLAMTQEPLLGKLGGSGGIVEVDETYIGGKASNNRRKKVKGRGRSTKIAVMTLIERGGDVRTFKVPNTKGSTLKTIVRPNVDDTALIVTDENAAYRGLNRHFANHGVINHSKSFVRGILHTNFAESYHSLLKRGILGTFHHVSEQHLPRYLREFEFRWNSRKITDGERTFLAIKSAKGKRLVYQRPTSVQK
jgi:transposase-like protein